MRLRIFRPAFALCLGFVAIVESSAALSAHDMWIEPATFFPRLAEIVPVHLLVGQDLLGDPLPRDGRLIDQFIVEDAEGRKPVVGRDGRDPAGFVRAAAPGVMIVGYHSRPSAVELPAEKFNQYLKEEGLDVIAALRARRGETNAPARELFARCAKSLVVSGSTTSQSADRVLGFPLELVAENNPYARGTAQELSVRLLYDNRPLAGALVAAMNRLDGGEKVTARTDRDGRVRLRLRSNGMWLVKAVHMIAAPPASGAQWASFWASLTFERGSGDAAGR